MTGYEHRLKTLETALTPVQLSRFLVWSHRPDDPDYVDGPVTVDCAATLKTYECANQAELVALITRLNADGSAWPPNRNSYSRSNSRKR